MAALAAGVTSNVAKVKGDAAVAIGRTLARTTPVDTALARSNWVASANSPDLSDRPIRSVADVVSEIKTVVKFIDSETDIVIANGGDKVPYLGLLENGSSRQAPAGFIAASPLAGVDVVQKGKILTRRRRS